MIGNIFLMMLMAILVLFGFILVISEIIDVIEDIKK
nr:MAG TPA: hypothetical protein [Caudoviricetes sp.]